MPHSLFISDLHLCAKRPQCAALFLQFLERRARDAEALYILGDLFEYWAGDDDLDDPFHRQVVQALQQLAASGVKVFLMHGNRDLLMGGALENASGAALLPDPTLVDLYGTRTLVSHGDRLCTDDVAYQAWRSEVRKPEWQQLFLAQPLEKRKAQIEEMRSHSEKEKKAKSSTIMDVNADAVAALLREHGYPRLIHGHTHRMGHMQYHLEGHICDRWVLGDWHETGNTLCCDAGGCRLEEIT
jgi:UDP-2,3-diacylglucosamine hydrolase